MPMEVEEEKDGTDSDDMMDENEEFIYGSIIFEFSKRRLPVYVRHHIHVIL
jgi:hypothetical protein